MKPDFPRNRYHEIEVWAWRQGVWHRVGVNIRTWTLRDYRRFSEEYEKLLNIFAMSGSPPGE